ncbi:MAG: 30S ribosome-binding factor RbfA [Planctomycetota bacterium]|jgi:ribosome-binding factor A
MASPVRRKRVAERLKQEIGGILLSEIKDPRIGMVSVVRVKVSADLRTASVYVSVLGDDADKKKAMQGIQHARGFIQTHIAKRVDLRFAPILRFHLDESIERSVRLSKILNELSKEWEEPEPLEDGTGDAAPPETDLAEAEGEVREETVDRGEIPRADEEG